LITGKSYTYGQDYYDKKIKDYIDEDNLKKYFITQASQTAKKISNTLNFATHKSDPDVTHFINNIRDYEQD